MFTTGKKYRVDHSARDFFVHWVGESLGEKRGVEWYYLCKFGQHFAGDGFVQFRRWIHAGGHVATESNALSAGCVEYDIQQVHGSNVRENEKPWTDFSAQGFWRPIPPEGWN